MLLHAHHVYSMTGQRCSVLCYCVGTKKRNGFDVLTLYLPPNLHPTPHRTWRRVVASLLKPGSVFGVVAIGMGSAKLVEKLTRRLSNRTIREMSVESPNPMYGQHGRATQANEGGMEAAARAVSTSFESKRVEEKGWEGGEKTDARGNVGVVEGSGQRPKSSNNDGDDDDDDDDDEEEEEAVETTVETTTAGAGKGGKRAGTRRTSFLRKEDENKDLLAYLSDLITTNAASASHNKQETFQVGVTAKTHLSYMTVKTQIVAAYGSQAFERNKGAVQAMLESHGRRSSGQVSARTRMKCGGGDGRGRTGGGETRSTGAEDSTEAELGGLELAVIRNTDVSLRTSTPEEEFAFEDGTGGAPVDVQIEIGEGKERAGLSMEGHDTNIITRMQATQRMKQAQRLHEGEHGINV